MPPVNQMRIGVVGLGFMGASHLKAWLRLPDARVAALCNPSGRNLDGDFSRVGGNIGTAEPLRLDMSNLKAFQRFEDLLSDPEIDVIDICTPTHLHRAMCEAALASGKHVLCEKPLARTFADAAAIAAAADKAKGLFMPAMCLRFWPGWAWLKEAIASGRYGGVLSASFRRVTEPPAWSREVFLNGALSGGALLDLHIHDTDFIQFCFGMPKSVCSAGYSRVSDAVDHVVTHYQYGANALILAEGSWAMHAGFGFSMGYTVNFQRATAEYDLARGDTPLRLLEEGCPPQNIACEKTDGYTLELRYFLDCVAAGVRPALVTAAQAADSVRICEAEELSVRTHSPAFL